MRKKALIKHGDQSPNPWDLPHSSQNAKRGRQAAPAVPAPRSALRFHPWSALSSVAA